MRLLLIYDPIGYHQKCCPKVYQHLQLILKCRQERYPKRYPKSTETMPELAAYMYHWQFGRIPLAYSKWEFVNLFVGGKLDARESQNSYLLVWFWCFSYHTSPNFISGRLYSVQKGISIDSKSPDCKVFLLSLMDSLENVRQFLLSDFHPSKQWKNC